MESHKFEVLGTREFLFRSIECLTYREVHVDIRRYNPQNDNYQSFPIKHMFFVCKETSLGDISFTHTKHMGLFFLENI